MDFFLSFFLMVGCLENCVGRMKKARQSALARVLGQQLTIARENTVWKLPSWSDRAAEHDFVFLSVGTSNFQA